MTRISALEPEATTGHAHDLLVAVKGKLGMVPNMMRTLAHAPAALDAYLQFSGKLAGGVLPAKTREQLALTVGSEESLRLLCRRSFDPR